MTISERISERMREAGVSTSELRRTLEEHHGLAVSRQTIHSWRNGQRPALHHLDLVMDALVVPSADRREWEHQWLREERDRVSA